MAGLSYLADACALIVFHGRAAVGMTEAGRRVMEDGDVFVPPITAWEIVRESRPGKLARPVPADYTGGFSAWLSNQGYRVLPLTWDDCERADALPDLHKDPMDRMLIASALGNDLTIVINDRIVASYPPALDPGTMARQGNLATGAVFIVWRHVGAKKYPLTTHPSRTPERNRDMPRGKWPRRRGSATNRHRRPP